MVSISRRHQPPAATGFNGCSGNVATDSVPLNTCTVPKVASLANGAISFGVTSTWF